MRLFIALPLSVEVKDRMAALRTPLPGARWVAPEQSHLTLHFLGEVEETRLPALATLVNQLTTPAFSLTTDAIGVFPSTRQPRVLWLGLKESPPLRRLHGELAAGLATAGIDLEQRPFHPHLTLARLRETPPQAVAPLLNPPATLPPLTFAVDRVILYASILGTGGARHTPQAVGMLPDAIPEPP